MQSTTSYLSQPPAKVNSYAWTPPSSSFSKPRSNPSGNTYHSECTRFAVAPEGRRNIGVGTPGYPGRPSLRTVQADLPHTALQLVVLPTRGLHVGPMGIQ